MDSSLVPSPSEYERLLEEVKQLQARLVWLTALRDDLTDHVCPALRALYEEKIAFLERELLAAQIDLREKQRILELLQADMNRRKKPSFEQAEKQARQEHKRYEEDLKHRAEEAKKFRDYWTNQSKWQQHDQAEKNRPSEKTDLSGKSREDAAGRILPPSEELKSLYRKIVKRLHPDVHPDPTPREKELLRQAQEAYKIGDLEKMRGIWEEITGLDPPETHYEDSEEGREQLRALVKVLQAKCTSLEREILKIRSEYPYTMKAFLDDENAVEERRRELKNQIREVRGMDRQLAEYIERMKKQMGGEPRF